MPPHHFFDPTGLYVELIYTTIVFILCLFVYYKTKEIHDLTKHKGIKFFRCAFLFFGLAYAARLFLHLMMIGRITLEFHLPRPVVMPFFIMFTGYLSSIAILYLTYSTIWKKIKSKYFIIASHVVVLLFSMAAFIYRSHYILLLFQAALFIFAVVMSFRNYRKSKKLLKMKTVYSLLFIFWILNLSVLGPRMPIPFEVNIIMQLISIFIFVFISYKVHKWTK